MAVALLLFWSANAEAQFGFRGFIGQTRERCEATLPSTRTAKELLRGGSILKDFGNWAVEVGGIASNCSRQKTRLGFGVLLTPIHAGPVWIGGGYSLDFARANNRDRPTNPAPDTTWKRPEGVVQIVLRRGSEATSHSERRTSAILDVRVGRYETYRSYVTVGLALNPYTF